MTHHPDWFVQYDRILNTETLVTAIATHLGITTPTDISTTSTPEAEALASVPVYARGGVQPAAAQIRATEGMLAAIREGRHAFEVARATVLAALHDPDDPDWLTRLDAEHRIEPVRDPEDPFEHARCTCGRVFVTTSRVDRLALFKHRADVRLDAILGASS